MEDGLVEIMEGEAPPRTAQLQRGRCTEVTGARGSASFQDRREHSHAFALV